MAHLHESVTLLAVTSPKMREPAIYRIQNVSAMGALGWGQSGQNRRRIKMTGQTMVKNKSIALGRKHLQKFLSHVQAFQQA